MSDAAAPEAARQRALLLALQGDPAALPPAMLRTPAARQPRALQAYRAHAAVQAEQVLGAAYPTLRQVVGDEAFALLSRRFLRAAPPLRGDLSQWGDALPAFLQAEAALADEPYLGDLARVEWAVHRAQSAADAASDPASLARLATEDAGSLQLQPAPGAALVVSPHPVAAIWLAHRSDAPDRFAAVRAARAAGLGEAAFVWRRGWRIEVAAVEAADTAFMQAWLAGAPLGAALDRAGENFTLEPWLQRAVSAGWLLGVGYRGPPL